MADKRKEDMASDMLNHIQDLTEKYWSFLSEQQAFFFNTSDENPKENLSETIEIQKKWMEAQVKLWESYTAIHSEEKPPVIIEPNKGDRRFNDSAWTENPFYSFLYQSYLINSKFFQKLAENTSIDDDQKKAQLEFVTRQFIDAMSPANFPATNPEFIQTAIETKGESITKGMENLLQDLEKGHISLTDETAFKVGENLAMTEGEVVYENNLMQLIQYKPLTEQVSKRPFVVVPPCINRYYIMDLKPENSFIRYAVSEGQTVFLISWRNIKNAQSQATWDDYIQQGPLKVFEVAKNITQEDQVNALGFCIGGTLLSSAIAVQKAQNINDVASLTLLTTLLDFENSGELGCFIDQSLVEMRENTIGQGGIVEGSELAMVFSSLRANDLMWYYVVNNYLKGNSPVPFDLLYWNSDSTNLPGPFYTWYLRNMYLENNLKVPGKLSLCGQKVDLSTIDCPTFIYASQEDHIVPWESAYVSRQLLGGKTTFVLGASGHIAGVINPPSKKKRCYWVNAANPKNSQDWFDKAKRVEGSWWPCWAEWLSQYTDGQVSAPQKLGNTEYQTIEPAPGSYVKE